MPEGILGPMLRDTLAGAVRDARRAQRPAKWCRTCHRKHPRGVGCQLVEVAVQSKSGHLTQRRVHRSRAS